MAAMSSMSDSPRGTGGTRSPGRRGSAFLKSLRRRNPELLRLVVAFNARPVAHAHPDRLAGLAPPPALDALLQSPRGRRALSLRMAGGASALGEPEYDFKEPRRRLALVDTPTLERTLLVAGVAANAGAVARIIDHEHVRAVRGELGEDLYGFAVRRAGLLAGGAARDFADPDPLPDVAGAARRSGARLLTACFSGEPAGLLARFSLRFGPDSAPDFPQQPDPARDGAFHVLRRVLTREVAPKWAALFA